MEEALRKEMRTLHDYGRKPKRVGTNRRLGRITRQGVDHVLRPMREPAHPWGAILHALREGDTAGWRGDIFSNDGASI